MKRLVGVFVILLILYAVYYDLSEGTLPASFTKETAVDSAAKQTEETTYFEQKVDAGDTVISIIEDHLNESISVPITEVINDFKELNKGVSPQEIQQGMVYKFPDYSKAH
ncbi:hypothetical protein [Bacillus tuaregi]|uniref:hypothetical protein n=1 Tax=Bacillus tuaregi TaxID=1816695 RepID=UPI0008F8D91F|nr:hypothetical protein [Bacillus tuaregi]